MKVAVSLLTVSSAAAFSHVSHRRSFKTALHSGDYDAQYQSYAGQGARPNIQPVLPGSEEAYGEPRPYGGPLAPYIPETAGNDERNYGFRVYGDMARNNVEQLDSPPGQRIRPDYAMNERAMGRGYGNGGMYNESDERIQGNSLNTYKNYGDRNMVDLTTDGRDLYANVEMWNGPDNTAQKVSLYSQDGSQYGVRASFTSNTDNSLAIRNKGDLQFPMRASVSSQPYMGGFSSTAASQGTRPGGYQIGRNEGVMIQGDGMVQTLPIAAEVQSVQVILHTEGMPLSAKVELLQGPNNVKVLGDVYNDGMHGPFEAIIDTPGMSSTLRIENTGPMTYPFRAIVRPYTFGEPTPVRNPNTMSRFGPDGRYREW